MKLVITPRLDYLNKYKETRISLDINWIKFLDRCNLKYEIFNYDQRFKITNNIGGLILTGGNTLANYFSSNCLQKKISTIRDKAETNLIKSCVKKKIPIIGVCRGMQLICNYFGMELSKINKHIATTHKLIINKKFKSYIKSDVNSYHSYGLKKQNLNEMFIQLALHKNSNTLEAIKHKKYSIYGIMWHPERYQKYNQEDINLFKMIFK